MKTSLEGQVSSTNGTVYVLDVIKSRDLSNHIANYFGVEHQSPQFLVIKNKEVILYQNHWEIDATELVFP